MKKKQQQKNPKQTGSLSLGTSSATIIRRLATEHKQLNMSETHSVSRMGLLWFQSMTDRVSTCMFNADSIAQRQIYLQSYKQKVGVRQH